MNKDDKKKEELDQENDEDNVEEKNNNYVLPVKKHSNSNSGGKYNPLNNPLKHLVVKAVKKFKSESSKGVIDLVGTPKKVKGFNSWLGSNKSNGKLDKKK